MTKTIDEQIEECPHRTEVNFHGPALCCDYHGMLRMDLRDPACIAAEQCASCSTTA